VFLYILLHFTENPLFGIDDHVWKFFTELWLPAQLPVFLLGVFTYHLTRDPFIQRRLQSRLVAFFCFAASLAVMISTPKLVQLVFVPRLVPMAIGLAGLILSVSAGSLALITNRVACYIGKLSYSCYLVHFAAVGICLDFLGIHPTGESAPWDAGSHLRNGKFFVALYFTSLLLTLMVAAVTRKIIEEPGIAFGRGTLKRINDSAARAKL
jgi:peptidoglycan/LPS O-acetylase OafA/YrhL